jgi:phage tail protein X
VVVVDLLAEAVSAAVGSVVPDTLQAELVLAEAESVLAECTEAELPQSRPGTETLILPLEVSADQPVHLDPTTEAAAHLLLGHINSAAAETNR